MSARKRNGLRFDLTLFNEQLHFSGPRALNAVRFVPWSSTRVEIPMTMTNLTRIRHVLLVAKMAAPAAAFRIVSTEPGRNRLEGRGD